ncbi:MAG: hypothetical protein H3C26_09645 [Rhodocyclaceae bacterium]|nr:hypothetical protein [Rhodocyclaceae bacterium]
MASISDDIATQMAALDKKLAENARQFQTITSVKPAEAQSKSWWRADEAMTISAVVLVFGVTILVLAAILLRRTVVSADSILRVFGTVLIIIGAIFLVVAGYTEQQMGPVMGLLGTIAGYLLGKSNNNSGSSQVGTPDKP